MKIVRYTPEYVEDILDAITKEPDWEIFTSEAAIDRYRSRLNESVTYVCYDDKAFCGYVRAILDDGFAVYISELYVVPAWRNRGVGRSLMAQVKADHGRLLVYALSDEDAYYEKLGYRKAGSVFEVV